MWRLKRLPDIHCFRNSINKCQYQRTRASSYHPLDLLLQAQHRAMASFKLNYPIPTLLILTIAATFCLLAGKCSGEDNASPRASNALSKLCSDVDFPQLCDEIIKGSPDAKNATQMAIQALSLRAAHAKALAVKLGSLATGYLKSSLDTCAEVYDDAVDSLETSLDNIQNGDKKALFNNLAAVLADITTCDDTIIAGDNDPHAALGKSNKVMQKLGSNCLALAEEIRFWDHWDHCHH